MTRFHGHVCANKVSRASFEAFGACDEAARVYVRRPTDDEIRGRN